MIPKKIHWCWLSGDSLPPRIQRCVNSWHKVMPDYEIVLWDMNRFDIHSVPFVEQACATKKWAFAADYIRQYALYTEGGIYLDSDVRVFRRFDEFLHYSMFTSVEYTSAAIPLRNPSNPHLGYAIQAAVIGAEKGNEYIKKCMEFYHTIEFKTVKDAFDTLIAPYVMAFVAEQYGFQYDFHLRKPQVLDNNMIVFPHSVFATAYHGVNLQSYAMHCCAASWMNPKKNILHHIEDYLVCNNRLYAMLHYWRKTFTRNIFKR